MSQPKDWNLPEDWLRAPDGQALFAHGERLETRARQLLAEAQQSAAELQAQALGLFDLSARAGSVDGLLARARLAVADGASFGWAQNLLAEAGRRGAELSRPAVAVAVDVLGTGLSLDGPDTEVDRSPAFTVISPYPDHAAATLERVSERLMAVDEHGHHHEPHELDDLDRAEAYTPNYITPVEVCAYGARVSLDTKGVMWSAMGRTMVSLIVDALAGDAVPAVVAGDIDTLDGHFRRWERTDLS
jgi:hypothetical protein